MDVDEFEMDLIDGGAEDVVNEDGVFIVYTSFEDFGHMQKKLEELNIESENADLQRIPNNTTTLDIHSAKTIMNMMERFEEDDDVTNVYHNLELTEELLEQLD